MIKKTVGIILLLQICWFLGSCAIAEPTPSARNLIPFHAGEEGRTPMVRVVLLPLLHEDSEDAVADLFGASLQNSMTRRNLFEVMRLREEDLAALDFRMTRERGVFRSRDLVTLSRRFGADGVLTGTVTRFRAFPAVQLGVHLSLIDCRVGDVRWASDFFLDAADAAVDQDVHNYHDIHLRDQLIGGHRTVLVSPRLFCDYAATRTTETIERVLRPALVVAVK